MATENSHSENLVPDPATSYERAKPEKESGMGPRNPRQIARPDRKCRQAQTASPATQRG